MANQITKEAVVTKLPNKTGQETVNTWNRNAMIKASEALRRAQAKEDRWIRQNLKD